MKKFTSLSLYLSALVTAFFFSLADTAVAQTLCPTGRFAGLCNIKVENGNASRIVTTIVTIILILAVVVSLMFLIWGGIRWTMSGGDKGKIDQARGTITAALIGLLISFLSFFIVSIVSYVFTGQSGFNFEIPTLVP